MVSFRRIENGDIIEGNVATIKGVSYALTKMNGPFYRFNDGNTEVATWKPKRDYKEDVKVTLAELFGQPVLKPDGLLEQRQFPGIYRE